jgi:hypothetical protein
MNELDHIIEGGSVAVICIGFGRALKGIPAIPDWTIPFALVAVGIGATCLLDGPSRASVIKGAVSGFGAVWGNQAWRQAKVGADTIFLKKDKNADSHNS